MDEGGGVSAWITLDVEIGKHPKMAELPSDTARYGWILALLEAKKQRHPGTFASAKHFRLVMGRHGRFLPLYLKAKLLEEGEAGELVVHDWRRHQWAVAAQIQRGRRDDAAMTLEGLNDDASRAVSVPVSVSVSEDGRGGVGETADSWAIYCGLTGAIRPSPNVVDWLTRLEDRYGAQQLADALRAEWQSSEERRTYLSRTEHRLEKTARESETATVREDRSRQIFERMQERRLDYYRETGEWKEAEWGPMPAGSAA